MPLYVWKKLMLLELIPTHMTLELANQSVVYPASIAEDVCVQVGKFTFLVDFVVINYDVDPCVPLILGRPFLRTACALVDVYGEELILRDGDEKLIFHADSTSKHPQEHGNDGNTTSPSNFYPSLTPFETSDSLLEEFTDELAFIEKFPQRNEDDNFDLEADLKEIEYFLNRDPLTDSSPTTDIDIINHTNDMDIIDPTLERFTDKPALVYSSPPGDDDDDLFDIKSFNEEWKRLLNEDKVFNPGILVYGSTHVVTSLVTHDMNFKKKTSFEELLILKERKFLSIPSNRELPFHYELPGTETLLSFSSENEDNVFSPGILISKGVHSLTLGLSHQNYEAFKIVNVYPNILNGSPMKIFPFFYFFYGGDISSLDVPYLHFYPR
uniref:Reverse transcriptase domain-containing protein n=1 Tax=Tanacetum cinerariifolium TaxID=118510 RepID=A0A699KPT1_TANCI|nr:reverse transcriptase domain-containing protein [Tanacetum cinerariifolium]